MVKKFDVKYNFIRWFLIIFFAVIFGVTAKRYFKLGTGGLIIGSGIGASIVHFYLYFKDKK